MGIRENNETSKAHNTQSLADNIKRMHVLNQNGYTTLQALAQMELLNGPDKVGVSAAQMWLQIYNTVSVNWPDFMRTQKRKGGPLIATSFYSSSIGKSLKAPFMAMFLAEVPRCCYTSVTHKDTHNTHNAHTRATPTHPHGGTHKRRLLLC